MSSRFRRKNLDAAKPLEVYRARDRPEILEELDAINREVPEMPTGMEKEEEEEVHVKQIIDEQARKGTLAGSTASIPIPEIVKGVDTYKELFPPDYRPPKSYILAKSLIVFAEEEPPAYDLDTEDEAFLDNYNKRANPKLQPIEMEALLEAVEKHWPISLERLLEAEPDHNIQQLKMAFNYYSGRLKKEKAERITPRLKADLGDTVSANDPYVAFRRRKEKMRTRQTRSNQEASFVNMLKLQRDLQKAKALFVLVRDREKTKAELLQSELDVFLARVECNDWDGQKEQDCTPWSAPAEPEYEALSPTETQDSEPTRGAKAAHKGLKVKLDLRRSRIAARAHARHLSRASALSSKKLKKTRTELPEYEVADTSAVTEDEDHHAMFRFRRRGQVLYHQPVAEPSLREHADGQYQYVSRQALTYWDSYLEQQRMQQQQQQEQQQQEQQQQQQQQEEAAAAVGLRQGWDRVPWRGFCRRRVGRGGRVIVDRLHPLYDYNNHLTPFTPEQVQDSIDTDAPNQLLLWRLPKSNSTTATGNKPSNFPAAGTDFGDGGEDVGSGPMVKVAATNSWVTPKAAPPGALKRSNPSTPGLRPDGQSSNGGLSARRESQDGRPPAKRAISQDASASKQSN
eukprot:TRINITY_DN11865_c1_g10_i1.p1 TRINITY_DN11865_c1_g10~~TRINITY_DN11865_c1_g10_i1.p1  ORF type:complete len:627 (+),score=164.54 TRINITY_DN11865_c1_g10_i1:266-2146(+)